MTKAVQTKRLQRLKQNPHLRNLMSETGFTRSQLIQPLFTVENLKAPEEIKGLKGTRRLSVDDTLTQVEKDLEAGVTQFILFPVPAAKQNVPKHFDITAQTLTAIKKRFGSSLQLWVDTCLCSFTDHGHCCVFHSNGQMDHEATLQALAQSAVISAQAGADGISPSDMIDGRVAAIRRALDDKGLNLTPIMSYSTKFASNFYGPFRNAANSAPAFGDRTQYQLDVRSRREALNASQRCADEGADLLMVKPGMTSIDLVAPIAEQTGLAVGAYQVSGEFAGIALLAQEGLIDFNKGLLESWHVFKRAGCQYIITYGARFAKELGVP